MSFRDINWEWVGLGFCFFVVYHLLPTYIFGVVDDWSGEDNAMLPVWMFGGLAIISWYIAYRAHSVSVIEPPLSATFYLLALGYAIPKVFTHQSTADNRFFHGNLTPAVPLMILLMAFLVCAMSAYVGGVARMRREAKLKASSD